MRFYENIILDTSIKDVKNLKRSFSNFDFYAVCVSEIGKGLMEIISLNNALKDMNEYKKYGVIAIVKGKESAEIFSAKLIEDWLKNNSDLKNFREYYNLKCK